MARKALRVNLSDLAAMVAARGFTLAMALSRDRDAATNEARVAAFAAGLAVDIAAFDWPCGAATVSPPRARRCCRSPPSAWCRRAPPRDGPGSGPRPVYVSGTIGDAALGLRLLSDAARLPAPQAAAAIDRFSCRGRVWPRLRYAASPRHA